MATTGYAAAIDSNDIEMAYIAETVWGTTPSGNFQAIRLDSEGFSGTKSRTKPNEIDPSGQASASITTKEEATGSLNFSVSAGTHNDLIAASLAGVWSTAVSYTGSDVAITAADGSAKTCTITATAATFATTPGDLLVVGQCVKVYAGVATTQRGIARVKAVVSDTEIDLDCCSWTPVITAAGTDPGEMGATTIKGRFVRNGTTFNSFSFEKKLSDSLFLKYAGSFPSGGSLDVGTGDYLKGTLSFLCKAQVSGTTSGSTGAYAAPPTGTVIDSIKGIGTVWRGVDAGTTPGPVAAIAGVVQKIGVKWNKEGAASQFGMGSVASLGVRPGKMQVTGSLSTYFADFALYDQYINEQTGPISFHALDGYANSADAKGYVITFCNATIMNPKVVAGGPGQDIMADFEIEGNPDVCSMYGGKTIQIDYFG